MLFVCVLSTAACCPPKVNLSHAPWKQHLASGSCGSSQRWHCFLWPLISLVGQFGLIYYTNCYTSFWRGAGAFCDHPTKCYESSWSVRPKIVLCPDTRKWAKALNPLDCSRFWEQPIKLQSGIKMEKSSSEKYYFKHTCTAPSGVVRLNSSGQANLEILYLQLQCTKPRDFHEP